MNPTAQNLDPKLKETYDRIMGTQVNPKSIQPTPQPQQTAPNIFAQASAAPSAPSQPAPEPASVTPNDASAPQMVNINATIPQAKAVTAKKGISPIMFIAIGVGFFLLYTVVWLKVFKIF